MGLSWPLVSSEVVRAEAEANMRAAEEAGRAGEDTRRLAEQFASDMKGRFVGAMYQGYINDSEIHFAKEKFLTEASHAGQKVADETLAAKSHLDHLDWQAHQKIEEMAKAGPISEAAKWALIGQTAASAAAYMTSATAQVASQTAKVTGAVDIPHKSAGAPGGRPGKPFHESPKIDRPGEVKPMGNEHGKDDGRGGKQPQDRAESPGKTGDPDDTNSTAGERKPTDAAMHRGEKAAGENSGGKPSLGNAAGATPFSGGTPSGGSSSGSGSPASGLGSGLMGGGSNPAQALQSGLKSAGPGGSPSSGLSSGGSGFGKGVPGTGQGAGGSAAQVNPVRDFARGFTSTSGAPTTPLAQPAAHTAPPAPPAAPTGSGAPAAAPGTAGSAGPLSGVAAAPPPAPVSPPPATGGAAVGGAGPNPSGLAPVGSDMGRHAAGPGSVVSGASSPGSAAGTSATSIAGGAATASMGAGLLGAAQGTAGNRTGDAPRDPLLADAVQLVFELLHGSKYYPGLDWCVAVFRTGGVVEMVVTSNEGACYVPVGVFLPRSVRPLFSDPLVTREFRDQWFGHTDPVATMVAYADLRRGEDGGQPIYALAASSRMGGALVAAESADIEHLHLCQDLNSPIPLDAPDAVLDELHVHRLNVSDPDLLAWMHSEDRTLAERTKRCDELSSRAFRATTALLGTSQTALPDIGAAVFNDLCNSEIVDESRWEKLYMAMRHAQFEAGAVRPTEASLIGTDVYRRRFAVAQFLEMLYWWRPIGGENAGGESICFTEIAYCARQIVEGECDDVE